MQVVVLKSPKCLRGLLRRLFGIRKETAGLKEMESRCAARGDLGRAAVLLQGA